MRRLTHTGVLARLGPQTGGRVTWRDLTALPCSHPHCCSVGYLVRDDAGTWRSLVSLLGEDRLRQHLDLVSNRIAGQDIPARSGLRSRSRCWACCPSSRDCPHPRVVDLWRDVCEQCDLGVSSLLRLALPGGPRPCAGCSVSGRCGHGQAVMDMNTMLEERLTQCCVHVGTRSASQDQCAPFCAVRAWPALSARRLSSSASGRARLPMVTLT